MSAPRIVIATLLLSASVTHADPAPTRSQLRSELSNAEPAQAVANTRFRPLCDRDGYPLVGNMTGKSSGYQPSQYCAAVRTAESLPDKKDKSGRALS